jgi:hypothetical protein
MQCKARDTPQCEHCQWRATPQYARHDQQNCANYSCAVPKGVKYIATKWLRQREYK